MVKSIIRNCGLFGEKFSLYLDSSPLPPPFIGITVMDEDPLVRYENGQGKVEEVRIIILVSIYLNTCLAFDECRVSSQGV